MHIIYIMLHSQRPLNGAFRWKEQFAGLTIQGHARMRLAGQSWTERQRRVVGFACEAQLRSRHGSIAGLRPLRWGRAGCGCGFRAVLGLGVRPAAHREAAKLARRFRGHAQLHPRRFDAGRFVQLPLLRRKWKAAYWPQKADILGPSLPNYQSNTCSRRFSKAKQGYGGTRQR